MCMLLVTIQLTLVFAPHTARPPWLTFSTQELNYSYLSQSDQYSDLARGRMTQGSTPSYVTYLSLHWTVPSGAGAHPVLCSKGT